jgi:hypothetical protein
VRSAAVCRGVLVLQGHDHPGPSARLWVSGPSPSLGLPLVNEWSRPHPDGVRPMIKDTAHRTWRVALTVGPLVAIALSLAAGIKWR